MNLVYKQHVTLVEVGKQSRKVARLLNCGAGGDTDIYSQLVRDNARERGLAQSRRAVEENVVEGFVANLRRLDVNAQRRGLSPSALSSGSSVGSIILFSKSKSSEKCVLLIYCLPICLNVMAISCSTGSELSKVASTGDTSAGV